MKKYNANGGQRRSSTFKLKISQSGFSTLMVEILKTAKSHNKETAIELLNRAEKKWQLTKHEVGFIKSMIEAGK